MTYEYRCSACGSTWEREQSITEHAERGPETVCPECHRPTAERVLGPVATVLRGDGWSGDGYSSDSLGEEDLR